MKHLLPLALLCVLGCNQRTDDASQLDAINKRIDKLQERIDSQRGSFTNVLSYLLRDIGRHDEAIAAIESKSDNVTRFFTIDPNQPSFRFVNCDGMMLLMMTESAEPYLDGFKINLLVGNPYGASFGGFKLLVDWNTPSTNGIVEYDQNKSRTMEFASNLEPISWNKVPFTISPATAADLRQCTVALELKSIMLNKPK